MIGADFMRALAGRNDRAKTLEVVPQRGEISGNDSGFLGRWMPTRWNPDELITRRGMRWYDKIRRDDAVKGAMALKKGAVLSPGWELTPAPDDPEGEDVVEFLEYVFENMEPLYGNLDDHLQQVLTALDYGFSITEIIWRTIEEAPYAGWWGLRTLKPRKPHRFWFDVDPHDNLLPDGIRQDENKYPVEKFLHWGYRREFGNWYGQSDLRETYEWWWLKDNLIKWSAIYAERFAIPIATGTYPAGHPIAADIVAFRTMLENIQANTSMTMSDSFKVDLKEAVGRGADVLERLIKAADTGIARAILMPSQLGVTAQPDVGTYAQARKHFDVLLIVVTDIQQDVARQVVQQQLIRRLVHANYGPRPLPTFEFKPLQEEDENRLFTMWLQAVTAGVVDTTPQDEIHIREMTDFPERTEEEIQAERDRLEAMLPQPGPREPGPEDEEEEEEEDGAGAAAAQGNGKPTAVAKATLAPPAHGKFVRRVRSRAYFDPDQPRDEGGKWTETGGSVAAEKAGKKWAEDLTATEKDAVSHYASAGYANINAHLRGKKTTKTPSNDEIERLTKALDKASLPEAVTVYRGISKSLKLRPDMEFQDKGFMSTTTSFRNAVIFTGLQGPEGKGAVLELKVPKGYRAAHIAGKFGAIESENELLLQRGARFRTTKRHRVKVGLHVITVYEAEII